MRAFPHGGSRWIGAKIRITEGGVVKRWKRYKVTRLQGYKVTRLQGYKVDGLPPIKWIGGAQRVGI
jgi:hypothetical protein